jgi:hypothetical protein
MSRQKVVVKDNFLPEEQFAELANLLMGSELPWYFNPTVVYCPHHYEGHIDDSFQFVHLFYMAWMPQSTYFDKLRGVLSELGVFQIHRIKANLIARTDKQVLNQFHVDEESFSSDGSVELSKFTTGILYMNTNNGYTEFEDGTKVESVANRMVTFPADTEHRGTSCTDEQTRVVINFNYIKRPLSVV